MTEAEITAALERLVKLGHDESGWLTLYRDAQTADLWEMSYPRGEMHGGGPRALNRITSSEAAERYACLQGI